MEYYHKPFVVDSTGFDLVGEQCSVSQCATRIGGTHVVPYLKSRLVLVNDPGVGSNIRLPGLSRSFFVWDRWVHRFGTGGDPRERV